MAETKLKEGIEAPLNPPKPFIAPLNKAWVKTPHRIKYDGIFDWEGLYHLIYRWFVSRNYYFEETSIKHKTPSPLGAEVKMEMSGWRKTTPYVKEWVTIFFIFYDMREVEVIKDGKKKKLTKGKVIMEIHGYVETDWQNRWGTTQFGQYLKEFYDKFFIKKDLENIWWDRLYYIMYKLHTEIKTFLDMEAKENAYYDMW